MGRRAEKREQLLRAFESHSRSINETLKLFDGAADSSLEKVEWSRVAKAGEDVSKQATISGMMWSGGTPDMKELEENMGVYFNVLQGFLLLCHSSTTGSGPTLLSCIRASAKQVVDRSLSLFKEPISSYGSSGSHNKTSIAQSSGAVWEACAALKKNPTTNTVAIGRAITQIAVSMKDVLREMGELKLAVPSTSSEKNEADDASDDELGNDLSIEEMSNAQLVTKVTSETLVFIKELIRFITGMLKRPTREGETFDNVNCLERLLRHCQEIGGQIDELGACVYPPQEISLMKTTAQKIIDEVEGIKAVVNSIGGSVEDFIAASGGLEASLKTLQSELVSTDEALVPEMEKLSVT